MAKLARTRLAGTIAATALCVVAATEATAQDRGQVLNNQIQLGDVIAGERLDVYDTSAQVSANTAAQGNTLIGGAEGQALDVVSQQTMSGNAQARTDLTLNGQTNGVVVSTTQASGNYLAAVATNTNINLNTTQTLSGNVDATSVITGTEARLAGGGAVASTAMGNIMSLGATGTETQRGSMQGVIQQATTGSVTANTHGSPRWVRDPADFSAQAVANTAQSVSGPNSNQELAIRQNSRGPIVQADVGIYAGNGWNLAARANATANSIAVYNQGGSLILTTEQDNNAYVRSEAELSSYDFGKATAISTATANNATFGNNDAYLDIDNTQVNTGGVEATATFTGHQGYDAYVGANAVGNNVSGYICATCQPNMTVTNSQFNSGNVSAMSTTTINSTGRHVITGTTAVGNAATFYTTRPGG